MLKRVGAYLSRLFLPHRYTLEGFRLTKRKYEPPSSTVDLPPSEKRKVTICNLFSNERKNVDEIARVLDTNRLSVISALLHEDLISDRRETERKPKLERRQNAKYHLARKLPSGHLDELRARCGQFGAETVGEFVFTQVLKDEERCGRCLEEISGAD